MFYTLEGPDKDPAIHPSRDGELYFFTDRKLAEDQAKILFELSGIQFQVVEEPYRVSIEFLDGDQAFDLWDDFKGHGNPPFHDPGFLGRLSLNESGQAQFRSCGGTDEGEGSELSLGLLEEIVSVMKMSRQQKQQRIRERSRRPGDQVN
jgi:hypothetical protein